MYERKINIYENEYWYGLCASDGISFPLNRDSEYARDFTVNRTGNQMAPFLVSSSGRYLWCDEGFDFSIKNGTITICSNLDLQFHEGFGTLREAYLAASKAHFPPNGVLPPKNFFTKPQYNTWCELIYNQNQEDILKYARNILENGLPAGIIMVDDNWNRDYGVWDFRTEAFPNPRAMVDELHSMGFDVMLWTCPFVSPDSSTFRYLESKDYLIKSINGGVSIKHWWNGYSAVLDLTNPCAVSWYCERNQELMDNYGIDGFKFDAGDPGFYSADDVTFAPVTPNGHSELWAKLGLRYAYNEYRACFRCAGLPLVQRLSDKSHSWENNGINTLLPNTLAQSILGYAYCCPDMIGGGSFTDFIEGSTALDEELFVRYAQCAAFMPMIQFSAAPWRVLSRQNADLCIQAAQLHLRFADYIYEYAQRAAHTGEPIIRYMEYAYPHQGFESVTDQFMVGERLLVAPVFKQRQTQRTVLLPIGSWKYFDGTVFNGGSVTVSAPLDNLPYFILVD